MTTQGWKFWVRRHGKPICFVVGVADREAAGKRLAACEPFAEVLDVEPVPDKVSALLSLQPDEVTGWSAMPEDQHLKTSAMTRDDLDPVGRGTRTGNA